ncbi:unnamed protein product [Paramecium sonneborni]|uniref:Papain family cysteine protease n=1 Tax=Paramecium sonneborni TaxID=65129 RepID=A0A8S1RHV6_9CILI|nr:unnamed protein product [Paramecium sonneborni]
MFLHKVILSLLFSSILATQISFNNFQEWKTQFNKNYLSKNEELYRFYIYVANYDIIHKHNQEQEHSYTLGENQFMDLTHEEFLEIYGFKNPVQEFENSNQNSDRIPINNKKVVLYDWSDYCPLPKNQGNCGAGWAYATAEIMECYNLIQFGFGYLVLMSQQQLIDCVSNNNGCETQSMNDIINAFNYANEFHISELDYYPQSGKQDNCKGTRGRTTYKLTQFETIQRDKYTIIDSLSNGPVVAGFDISGWQFYKDGTYDCFLDQNANHHAIIVKTLALQDQEDKDYIEIQNSWGQYWGRNGLIKYSFNYNCKVFNRPIYKSFKIQVY